MKKKRCAVVLVDFENIKYNAAIKGGLVDFKKLHEMIKEIGEILFAYVFIPDHKGVDLPSDINDRGFEIVLCQRTKDDTGNLEDSVDIHMIKKGIKYCNFQEVSDIVIVGNDGHMIHLVSEVENRGKKVTLIGIKELMSKVLIKVVDSKKDVYDLPVKKI